MLRRHALYLIGSSLAFAATSAVRPAFANAVREIKVGYQKGGILPVIKERRTLEAAFGPQNIAIKWVEFAFGPPILEGINTGNLDFGYTGDAPPIFAQAASANLVYAAALERHNAEGIVVHAESPIKTLADLKGKKIGFGKASSANTTTLYALEEAGLAYNDIQPVYLPPPDAAAAFARGSIDAWAIWDPYLAIAERSGARVLAYAKDVHHFNNFFLANKAFAQTHPELLTRVLDVVESDVKWAAIHREDVAQIIHDQNGVDLDALRLSIDRTNFNVVPVSEAIVESQQAIADRFLKIGMLPKPVSVRDIVWAWTPSF